MTAATANAINNTSANRPSAVGTSAVKFDPKLAPGAKATTVLAAAARAPACRHVGHGAPPLAARGIPGKDGRAARCIHGVRRAAPEQLHQFFGNRGAAEARRAVGVEHDQVTALESAGEIAGMPRR